MLNLNYRILWEVKQNAWNEETRKNEEQWTEHHQDYTNKAQALVAAENMAKTGQAVKNLKLQELGPVKTWKLEYTPPIKLVELDEQAEDTTEDDG